MKSKSEGWWQTDGRETVLSLDVLGGVMVAISLFIGGYFSPQIVPTPSILTTEAVIGGAVLAVALTALAILVAFLGDEYIALLERSTTVRKAILPYRSVATVAGTELIVSLSGIVLRSVLHDWGKDTIGALATGLTVCAVIGTVQIVNITARHGIRRARMPEIREKAREAQRKLRAG